MFIDDYDAVYLIALSQQYYKRGYENGYKAGYEDAKKEESK